MEKSKWIKLGKWNKWTKGPYVITRETFNAYGIRNVMCMCFLTEQDYQDGRNTETFKTIPEAKKFLDEFKK